MGYRWDPLPNSFLTPPTPHPCHAPPLPPPTLAETTGNILPEAGMRGKSNRLPWDVSKTGQQIVEDIRAISLMNIEAKILKKNISKPNSKIH